MTRTRLEELLGLTIPPVAIGFLDAPPAGVGRVPAAEAASCGYWKLAAAGDSFYTEASDHLNCAVGAHTHGVPTTPEQKAALMDLVQTMVQLEYLSMDEVAAIPHRPQPAGTAGGGQGDARFGVVAYAPLATATFPADVILVRGDVRQLMLVAEAAQAAGVGSGAPTMGRPTCAVLPQAMQSGCAASSFGCVGNRVYTGAGPGEGYYAIPAKALDAVVARLNTVVRANHELEQFHRGRQAAIGGAASASDRSAS